MAGARCTSRPTLAVMLLAGMAMAMIGNAAASQPMPLTRLSEIGPALQACWTPPPGSAGSVLTLRFGLTAQGQLKGPPLATYSRLVGTPAQQRAFVAAALLSLERCTPLQMQGDLARVVASRVLTLTFKTRGRELAI